MHDAPHTVVGNHAEGRMTLQTPVMSGDAHGPTAHQEADAQQAGE